MSVIDLLKDKSIFDKENIYNILDYMIVCLYSKSSENIKYLNCIEIVNECANKLKRYSNFDMTIDNLLIKLWEELNENCNRC